MSIITLVTDQAIRLARADDPGQVDLIHMFCMAAVAELAARLRQGLTPENCKTDFVAAACLYALAAVAETDETLNLQHIQLGDMSVKPGGGENTARCLREQAVKILRPYCVDNFSFQGV